MSRVPILPADIPVVVADQTRIRTRHLECGNGGPADDGSVSTRFVDDLLVIPCLMGFATVGNREVRQAVLQTVTLRHFATETQATLSPIRYLSSWLAYE